MFRDGLLPGECGARLSEALLQKRHLLRDDRRQPVAKDGEILLQVGDGIRPLRGVDFQELLHDLGLDLQVGQVESVLRRDETERRGDGVALAVAAVADPGDHARVVAEAGPQPFALGRLAEPVHVEELGLLAFLDLLAHLRPVREVVTHVVPAERQHGERVVPELAHGTRGRGRHLRADRGAEEDAVVPARGLEHQGLGLGTATAEEDGRDRDAFRAFPVGVNDRTLLGRGSEAGVRVGGLAPTIRRPVLARPVDGLGRRLLGHALPPHIQVRGDGAVGEDGVRLEGAHGVVV
mmetsp:Transcript_10893/g.19083  ORF Transcript_10893/g.19083 Transcript_10893/m.19083 type:complete len:293 (-) Transcript_10893:122-1000(-)